MNQKVRRLVRLVHNVQTDKQYRTIGKQCNKTLHIMSISNYMPTVIYYSNGYSNLNLLPTLHGQ